MAETLTIQTADGEFTAYVARPKVTPASVVVVLHEVFGVNADIRTTCQELADRGFIAVAPDLFWQQERGVALDMWSEAEWQKGLSLYAAYERGTGVRDILATIDAARRMPGTSGKVAVMGFYLGALLAFLATARGEVDAAVAYHGADTDRYLDEAGGITAPFIMHLAEEDEFIAKDAQARIKTALAGKANAQVFSYAGCNHAFARHTGLHYNAAAASLANGRTWAFLADRLSAAPAVLPVAAGA